MVINTKQPEQTRLPNTDIDHILSKYYWVDAVTVGRLNPNLFCVRDRRSGQQYILKRHVFLRPETLAPLIRIYRLAGELGFSPKMISTRSGELIGTIESTYFSLQEFVDEDTPVAINQHQLAIRLAELHRFLCEYCPAPLINHLFRAVTNMRYMACSYGYDKLVPMICAVEDICRQTSHQIIHGDLHPGNIRCAAGKILFIDFDTATFQAAGMDVAFCAFRCTDGSAEEIYRFVELYNDRNPPERIKKAHIGKILAYTILQRILFILIEADQGRRQWLSDLNNQQRYLSMVFDILHTET
jgi:Ser/Thr protein kinase RdoA (MazF antagonist)